MSFSDRILNWYSQHKRALPWRETRNPYIIWLSEIILQQTRVEQGLPYFLRFLEAYPNVTKFAQAPESEILRYWQGLGYYSRARNMHKTSQLILTQYGGEFPTDYYELLKLPGIGEYTAAAIASFSSNTPHAVLDGNVFRVLARYLGVNEPINSSRAKKTFTQLAQQLLSPSHPGDYNQGIMDFGSLVCKPKNPLCEDCVLAMDCFALKNKLVDTLPVKVKGKKSRDRYFHYFIIEQQGQVLMSQRSEGDVWANLYEFPLIETTQAVDLPSLIDHPDYKACFGPAIPELIGDTVKQILSHQNIFARFYRLSINPDLLVIKSHWNYYYSENLDKLAKHKLISSFTEYYFSAN